MSPFLKRAGSSVALTAAVALVWSSSAAAVLRAVDLPAGAWSDLGGGVTATIGPQFTRVNALAVYEGIGDGDPSGSPHGPSLYAGGYFTHAGGIAASSIARWDGISWHDIGGVSGGALPSVNAMAVLPDGGGGSVLVVAGRFSHAGRVAAENIAAWNGRTWSPLGDGLGGGDGWADDPLSLHVHDDGNGGAPTLYAAGRFGYSGTRVVGPGVASWDGTQWTAVGAPLQTYSSSICLTIHDDGEGPILYVGGGANIGGTGTGPLLRLGRETWESVPGFVGPKREIRVLRSVPGPDGARLIAAGHFGLPGRPEYQSIASMSGSGRSGPVSWSVTGRGVYGFSGTVLSLQPLDDDGDGTPSLYAGGDFDIVGGTPAMHAARWSGRFWTPLAEGVDGPDFPFPTLVDDADGGVSEFDSLNNFTGIPFAFALDPCPPRGGRPAAPRVIVAGGFLKAGDLAVNRIAAWTPPEDPRPGPFPHRCDRDIAVLPVSGNITALTPGGAVGVWNGNTSYVVTEGVVQTIASPQSGWKVVLHDLSDDGAIAGQLSPASGSPPDDDRAFRLDLASGQWTIFEPGSIPCSGCAAVAIIDESTVAGFDSTPSGDHLPCTWTGVEQEIFTPPGAISYARPRDANALGQIVGGTATTDGMRPFLVDGNRFMLLPVPDDVGYGYLVQALRINDAGTIIGRSPINSVERGVVWQGGRLAMLPDFDDGLHAMLSDINNKGVIVGEAKKSGVLVPAIWQDGTVTPLRWSVGWPDAGHLFAPARINDSGQVAGLWNPRSFANDGSTALLSPRVRRPTDIDGDCRVDLYDLDLLLVEFGRTGSVADVNGDGDVDGADLGALLADWDADD